MKFTDENERRSAQAVLNEGKSSEFWKLITQALKESKADIQKKQDEEDLKELPADQYKLENEIFKAKKEFIDKLLDTPDNLVSWLGEPDNEEKDYDPYAKVGEV